MKTDKLIKEYQQKVTLIDKEIERYTSIKNEIKARNNNDVLKYEFDMYYQDMIKDIAVCNGQRQAYIQFIENLK